MTTKMLIQLGDYVWLNPETIDGVIDNLDDSVTAVLASGQHVTIHGVTLDQVFAALTQATGEQAAGQQP